MQRCLRTSLSTIVLLLGLPVLACAQVLTHEGDPIMAVTDPAKAAPQPHGKATIPPLAVGQHVRLLEEKDGLARVSVESPEPGAGMDDAFVYRIPMTALHNLPGKTHLDRPAWLPTPAQAGTENRDVVAYSKNNALVVRSGQEPPRAPALGAASRDALPAVSPDGARLVFSPAKGGGNVLVSLDGAGAPRRFGEAHKQTERKMFSPDGMMLAWRADNTIWVLDLRDPQAKPRTLLRNLAPGGELQGFTADSQAVVVRNDDTVSWIGLDGKTRRSLKDTSFNDEAFSSEDRCIPSPVDANVLVISLATRGTAAYHQWANDVSGALFLVDLASGTNYRLTPIRLAAGQPAWSPDGKRLYFSALPDAPPNGPHHLYRMNADGTGLTDLGPGFAPSVGTRPETKSARPE